MADTINFKIKWLAEKGNSAWGIEMRFPAGPFDTLQLTPDGLANILRQLQRAQVAITAMNDMKKESKIILHDVF